MHRLLSVAVVCVLPMSVAASCARRQPVPIPAPAPPALAEAAPPAPPPPPESSPPPAPVAEPEEDIFARKTLDELNAERPLGDVFFDFERADLRDADRATLQTNAGWMNRWSTTRVVVEGHADSRGTSEYNLALSNRRATAVRSYLVSLGVSQERVMTVSKGRSSRSVARRTRSAGR